MGKIYHAKNQRNRQFATMFLVLLLGYLGFHLLLSERSIPSLMALSAQEHIIDTKLATIQIEKEKIGDQVARLRPETLDHDLLAEQAMKMLGKTSDNSVIILDNRS
jgi:cell division protein FtsB